MKQQRGGTFLGLVIGVVLGLAIALAVAVYVTKVPVPFMNKGATRSADQDAAEAEKNKNWDPNAPLYGKNPARAASGVASGVALPVAGQVVAPVAAPTAATAPTGAAPVPSKPLAPVVTLVPTPVQKPASAASADPLGDLAKAKSQASASVDSFVYMVQAGAF